MNRESVASQNVEKSSSHYGYLAYEKSHRRCLPLKEHQRTPAIIDLAPRKRSP